MIDNVYHVSFAASKCQLGGRFQGWRITYPAMCTRSWNSLGEIKFQFEGRRCRRRDVAKESARKAALARWKESARPVLPCWSLWPDPSLYLTISLPGRQSARRDSTGTLAGINEGFWSHSTSLPWSSLTFEGSTRHELLPPKRRGPSASLPPENLRKVMGQEPMPKKSSIQSRWSSSRNTPPFPQ